MFGYMPGVTEADAILARIWVLLLGSLVALNLAYVAAIGRDLEAVGSAAGGRP